MATGGGDDAADASSWKPMPTIYGGYPVEFFAAGFLCCHCSKILKDPFQGFCGHRLCKSCVEHLQVTNPNPVVCPGCVTDTCMEGEEPGQITFEKMFPDNAIKREMFPVPVKCLNLECSWSGPFRDYIKHQPECRFQAVVCGCGKSVPLHLLPDAAGASGWKPMPTFYGGYPVEFFASVFLCCHCSKILKDPFQGLCGHRFCKSCVEHLQVTNPNPVVCPGCVTDTCMEEEEPGQITFEMMFPDNAIKREMFPVPVKCLNLECSWSGRFRDYIKHQPECRFQAVVCGCGKSVPLHLLPEHQEKDCPNRTITCKYCNQKIKFSQRTEHNNSCPKNPIKCESCGKKKIPRDKKHQPECRFQAVVCGCGKSVPLHLLPEHQEKDCPNRTITCKYCYQKIKFSQRTEHNNSCPKGPIKCESCGKKKIPRDKFEEHLRECPTRRQKCPICEELVEVSKMDQHLKSNVAVHFVALANKQTEFQEFETGLFENLRACFLDMLQKVNLLECHIQAKDGNNLAIEGDLLR